MPGPVSFSGTAATASRAGLRRAPNIHGHQPTPRALDGKIREATEARAVLSTTGKPDMTVTNIAWTPTSPVVGDHVVFSATVLNSGSAPTPAGTVTDVTFTVKTGGGATVGTTWSDTFTSSIGTGNSQVLTATGSGTVGANYWVATVGVFDIDAFVNSASRFSELDSTNNHHVESVAITAPVATVPGVPVLTAVGGIGTVALSWTVPSDGGSAITAYRVRRAGVILNPPNSTTGATTYTDNAVVNGTAYSYTVCAVNTVGEGAQSPPQTATPFSSSGVPVLPADIVQAVPASRMTMAGGMYGMYNANSRGTPNDFSTWKSWGVGGHVFCLGGVGKTNTQLGKGSTAANEASSNYDWQIAMEGLGVPAINGGARGTPFPTLDLGPNFAKAKYPSEWKFYCGSPKLYRLGGDWFDDAAWAAQVTRMGNLAAMCRFLGASGFYWDTEDLNVPSGTGLTWGSANTDNPNFTHQQNLDKCEQRGYEIGRAIYTACPGLEIIIYDPVPAGSWYADNVYGGGFETSSNLGNTKMLFQFGILRAGAELGTAGRWAHLDHRLGYYMSPGVTGASYETAYKWNIMGAMSRFSRELPDVSRDYWMDKLDMRGFTWSSNTGKVGTYAYNKQLSPTDIVRSWTAARKWSMGGEFAEFETSNPCPNDAGTDGRPDGCGGPPSLYWNGKQIYHSDAGVVAGLLATASTTPNIDSSPITMGTISQSRVGSTVTVTVPTVAHKMGIRYVGYQLYAANGSTVTKTGKAVMTWSLNGANTKTPIDDFNPYMNCTMQIPNASPGLWVILDFCSGKDQHTYRRLQMV